ncbi:glycosyltransferase family 2 protein [Spirosoma koreense]
MNPVITVVIPTYRRLALLRNCLQALARQQLPTGVTVEILVVSDEPDYAVHDLTHEVSRQTGLSIRCLLQKQRMGPAAARNRGWRAANSPFVAFTDDDCLPQPTWLKAGLSRLQQGAQVLTGRVQMPPLETPTHYERTAALLETAEFVTANLFCARSALVQVGGFDEQFDSAWREDSDLQFKLLEAGMSIERCPEAVVIHPIRPAPWYASLRDERKNRYDALLYKRHPKLFRERIPAYRSIVMRYYGSVLGLLISLLALASGHTALALAGLGLWAVLTGWLIRERLPNRAVTWSSLKQAVLTSLATPFLSVYWRLYGAFTYKTWYW